jgi:hypothetical protein
MPSSAADRIVRDTREVLTLAGLPEPREGDRTGGYHVFERDGRVHVSWVTDSRIYNQAAELAGPHPHHPVARLDRSMAAIMLRAVVDVLYAAGFTVVLRPGGPHSNPEEEIGEVIVRAAPAFRAWADG